MNKAEQIKQTIEYLEQGISLLRDVMEHPEDWKVFYRERRSAGSVQDDWQWTDPPRWRFAENEYRIVPSRLLEAAPKWEGRTADAPIQPPTPSDQAKPEPETDLERSVRLTTAGLAVMQEALANPSCGVYVRPYGSKFGVADKGWVYTAKPLWDFSYSEYRVGLPDSNYSPSEAKKEAPVQPPSDPTKRPIELCHSHSADGYVLAQCGFWSVIGKELAGLAGAGTLIELYDAYIVDVPRFYGPGDVAKSPSPKLVGSPMRIKVLPFFVLPCPAHWVINTRLNSPIIAASKG